MAALTITADDLRAAQRELQRREEEEFAKTGTKTGSAKGAAVAGGQHRLPPAGEDTEPAPGLVLCTGDDYEAVLDVPTLRALRAATGLGYRRLLDATRHKLAEVIKIQYRLRRPVPMFQITLPAAAAGITFKDKLADAAWLRTRLAGVPVLLLSDYRDTELGDWLDAVPHVVLLHAGIPAIEATSVSREFWHGIGSGKDPQVALEEALALCAPETRHWVVSRHAEHVEA